MLDYRAKSSLGTSHRLDLSQALRSRRCIRLSIFSCIAIYLVCLLVMAWTSPTLTRIMALLCALLSASALAAILCRQLPGSKHADRLTNPLIALPDSIQALPCPALIYELSTQRILEANTAALNFFGYEHGHFLQQSMHEIFPKICDANAQFHQHLCSFSGTLNATYRITCEAQTPAGLRPIELHSWLVTLSSGPALFLLAVDNANIRQNPTPSSNFNPPDYVSSTGWWQFDPKTGTSSYSDVLYQAVGYATSEQQQSPPFQELLLANATDSTKTQLHKIFTDLSSSANAYIDAILPLHDAHGMRRQIHLHAESARDGDQDIGLWGTFRILSATTPPLSCSTQHLEPAETSTANPPPCLMIFAQETLIHASDTCTVQFGFPIQALLGQSLSNLLLDPDPTSRQKQLLGTATFTHPATTKMRRSDGTYFHAYLTVTLVRYAEKNYQLVVISSESEPVRMRDALTASNSELQALARRLLSLQEDERRAISRDLHDDIGQAITAIKLSAHAAREEDNAAQRLIDIDEIISLSDTTLVKLRNLSMLLRPPQLDALGLEAALRWQASMLFRSATVRLQLNIEPLHRRPCSEVEQACFRIAQEGLTNALRHACPGEVTLTLRQETEHQLYLEVYDDGDGFEQEVPRGLGMIVMRERAQSAGGSLRIDSAPGAGTRIVLHLPFDGEAASMSSSNINEC